MPVKLTNAALEEKDDKEIVLRGSIDPASLKELKVGQYQREVLPITTLNSMMDAVAAGRTPDVILGMRGEKFVSRNTNDFFLHNDVYIIDGLQRVSAGIRMLELGQKTPHIGALVYFNSSEKFEKAQFNALNTQAVKLSPNIIIRNFKDENEAVNMLFNLCHDRTFPLTQRVTWSQRAGRGELISAATFAKTVGRLHSFIATGVKGSRVIDLADALERLSKTVGRNTLRANTVTFFDTVDAAWGIRRVTYKDGAVQLRHAFLRCLAATFASHYDFWNGSNNYKLTVSRDMIRKLASFPIHDPTVVSLSGAAGKAHEHLTQLIVDHLDKGKRTGRLKSRVVVEEAEEEEETA